MKISFTVKTEDAEHHVSVKASGLTGKCIVTVDGDEFDVSTRAFSLRGTEQALRVGDEMAVLRFPKRGNPVLTVGDEEILPD